MLAVAVDARGRAYLRIIVGADVKVDAVVVQWWAAMTAGGTRSAGWPLLWSDSLVGAPPYLG